MIRRTSSGAAEGSVGNEDIEPGSGSTRKPPVTEEEEILLDRPTSGAVASPPSHRPSRRAVIGGGIVVAGAAAAAIALAVSKSSNGIGEGSGTGTITWVPTPAESATVLPQPFTGTIGGLPLKGTATISPDAGIFGSPSSPSTTIPKEIPFFIWKGSLGDTPFHLVLSITGLSFSILAKPSGGSPAFRISGTYGSENVNGDVPVPGSAVPNNTPAPIAFQGAIGAKKVTGLVHGPTGGSTLQTATVSYTMTDP
jgi:hypothetical protein